MYTGWNEGSQLSHMYGYVTHIHIPTWDPVAPLRGSVVPKRNFSIFVAPVVIARVHGNSLRQLTCLLYFWVLCGAQTSLKIHKNEGPGSSTNVLLSNVDLDPMPPLWLLWARGHHGHERHRGRLRFSGYYRGVAPSMAPWGPQKSPLAGPLCTTGPPKAKTTKENTIPTIDPAPENYPGGDCLDPVAFLNHWLTPIQKRTAAASSSL